jgi:uncharacterized repeat protein (TIGR01451 family)
VINGGPSDASGVSVTDTLPAGLAFVSVDPPCGRPDASGRVTCPIGNMRALSAVRIAIVVRPTAVGNVTNAVNVRGDQQDPVARNNSFAERITVNATADLSVGKAADKSRARYGGNLTYTMAIRNLGPSLARNVQLTDQLPATTRSFGTTFFSVTPSQGSCPSAPPSGTMGGTVSCNLGDLPTGANATVRLIVKPVYIIPFPLAVPPPTPPEIEFVNSATVTSDTFDPRSSNNTASVRVTGTAGGGIVITPQVTPTPRPLPR